jgi:NADH:ubiquinone oxidoreductase subunit F (NADH-binding)
VRVNDDRWPERHDSWETVTLPPVRTVAAGPAEAGLPRLLAGVRRGGGAIPLREHLHQHGPVADGRLRRAERAALIELVEQSGLRGRGGAAFPTGRKLRAVADGDRRTVVIANGAEGEPASGKDKLLLTNVPHLVLDGAVLSAAAIGASEAIVCVDREAGDALAAVTRALDERQRTRLDRIELKLAAVPPRYLAGEESALVNWLNGGPAKPTFVPPRPFERGVSGRPTLVQNVETLAQLALIARRGADWFRQLGTAEQPGSALVTLSGAIAHPGVYEIAIGTPLRDLLETAGGTTGQVEAFLIGGYFGSWLLAEAALPLPLAESSLRTAGCSLGAGAIMALPAGWCGLVETARIVRYLADENAGQCGPCVNGLAAIADTMALVARGNHEQTLERRLERWAGEIQGRGACHHPDGAARLVKSALRAFAEELYRHERDGPCRAARRSAPAGKLLPVAERSWR